MASRSQKKREKDEGSCKNKNKKTSASPCFMNEEGVHCLPKEMTFLAKGMMLLTFGPLIYGKCAIFLWNLWSC